MIKVGKTAVVMGLGVSGWAAVRYLLDRGMQVAVSDGRQRSEFDEKELSFLREASVETEFGGHTESFLRRGIFVVISPGINPDLPVLQDVRAAGIPVIGELALAAGKIDKPVVAVTGTNGKTTVTSLIGKLIDCSDRNVFVGGNIGQPLLDYFQQPSDFDVLVLELSSFQLEMAGDFRASVALLLNVTPDHLDRHGGMEQYSAIKMRIFDHQELSDRAIICDDDPVCQQLWKKYRKRDFQLFGHGEYCHALIDDKRIIVREEKSTEIYNLDRTQLDHHIGLLNSAAAILAARAVGCRKNQIEKGLEAFFIQPHRMERVGEVDGVAYYNDSKATNTGAVIAALRQITSSVVLIAGGRDKGDDYSLLLPAVSEKVVNLIVFGEAKEKISRALDGAVAIREVGSMEQAVRLAHELACPGDTVLLSPACASFDMFRSYGHRGEVFKDQVKMLNKEQVTE